MNLIIAQMRLDCLRVLFGFLILGVVCSSSVWASHGLGMGYEPKYKAGFQHFDYVNPNAPKGGTLKLSASGSFDKLNPFTLRGRPAIGMGYSGNGFVFAEYGLLFDSLTTSSEDEPFSRYGLLDVLDVLDGAACLFKRLCICVASNVRSCGGSADKATSPNERW